MLTTTDCPKCNYQNNNEPFSVCPKCGVIIEKYYASSASRSTPATSEHWKCRCGSEVPWASLKCDNCEWTRADYLKEKNTKMEFMSTFGRPNASSSIRDRITEQKTKKTKYPTLVFISKAIRIFGYVGGLIIIAIILKTLGSKYFSVEALFAEIVIGGVFLLICLAVSESIMVLIDIEENTRK